jgi:hypothetical protein
MSALTEKQIAAYEAKGFKRWTKGNFDRLYIKATKLGAEIDYYKTGNVRNATWRGVYVSNADGRRLLASKVFVDVKTGELHVNTSFSAYGTESLEDAAKSLIASIDAEDGERAQSKREQTLEAMRKYIEQKHVELDAMAGVDAAKREATHASFDKLLEKATDYISSLDYSHIMQLDTDPQKIALAVYKM